MTRFRTDGPPRWGAMLCALSVSLGVGLVGVSDRLDRLARGPEASAGYRVVAPGGSPAIVRGEPATLAAIVLPTRPGGELPAAAELLTRHAGVEQSIPMTAAGPGAFTATLPGSATYTPFEYAVEAGFARSAWHQVRIADPVSLAACHITVRPPPYAAPPTPRILTEWGDIIGIAGGGAELDLTFEHPPAAVSMRLAGPTGDAAPIEVALDGVTARAAFPLPPSATLKLTVTAGAGLQTSRTLQVRAAPDAPPTLTLIGGIPSESFRARPGDESELVYRAIDDAGSPRIELQIAGQTPRPVELANGTGRVAVPTGGAPGAVTRFRLVARDRSPAAHVATLPPGGWFAVTLDPAALPLAEQAVRATADESARRLRRKSAKLHGAHQSLRQALADPDGGPIAPEANAPLQSAALALAGCEPARKLALAAAEADDGRRSLIAQALTRVESEQGRIDAALVNLNRATELRLDAVALRELAHELERGKLSGPDAGRRLVGLIATRPGLRGAVAAADARADSEAGRLARAISTELARFERVAQAWPARLRVAASAGPRARQWLLLRRAEALAALTAQPARLAGAPPLDFAAAALARQKLVAGDLLDAAVAQETAAAAADRLADRLAATAAARADRRETLRQLARWGADLDRREPRPGELAALRAALDAVDPTIPPRTPDITRAAGREPGRAESVRLGKNAVEALRVALSKSPSPSLAGELARLDSRAWPAPPEPAVAALARASETRHPGDTRFAADALARLSQSLEGDEPPDLGALAASLRLAAAPREFARLAALWKSIAESAGGLSPATAERVSLAFRKSEGGRAAAALDALARRQSGDESKVDSEVRLDDWAAESPDDPRRQRLITRERELTPPRGFARFVGPPVPRDGDRLPAVGGDFLANAAAAQRLHRWAADQRQVRDATAAALAAANRPPAIPAGDPMAAAALRLDRRARIGPDADRLLVAARAARAGDKPGLEARLRLADGIESWRWDLADECARVSRRGAELAADARRLAAATAGPARELALDAAGLLTSAGEESLAEAGFRLDAAAAHLLPDGAVAPRGDDRLASAGSVLRSGSAGGATPRELRVVADQFERIAGELFGGHARD